MNNNFDELEDIFEEETELEIKPNINIDLLTQYINDPSLLERDINEGILPVTLANEYRNAVYAYPEIQKENPEINSGETRGKQKVKRNGKARLYENIELGYAEPMLLSLVMSLLGLLYLCALYLLV